MVSISHNAGYELFEVRNGDGLKPIHRLGGNSPIGTVEAVRKEAREVFTRAFGEDGRTKRENAQRMSKAFARFWEEGGDGWEELKTLTSVL